MRYKVRMELPTCIVPETAKSRRVARVVQADSEWFTLPRAFKMDDASSCGPMNSGTEHLRKHLLKGVGSIYRVL
jgi:hypothetical protein